jgi:hypothetical protein
VSPKVTKCSAKKSPVVRENDTRCEDCRRSVWWSTKPSVGETKTKPPIWPRPISFSTYCKPRDLGAIEALQQHEEMIAVARHAPSPTTQTSRGFEPAGQASVRTVSNVAGSMTCTLSPGVALTT